jgi:CHAT domain-containing protein
MNQQRIQAYLNLIQSLLTCPEGEEIPILEANQELVDEGFVTKLLEIAENLRQQGDLDKANRLMNIAENLLKIPSKSPFLTTTEAAYLDFLMQVLQAVSLNPTPEAVYPIFQQHLDKLDEKLGGVLEDWARDSVKYLATDIGNFSNLIQQFPLGNIAANLEIAIKGYQIALTVFTLEAFPQAWAAAQNNLGNSYCERIKGHKKDNLEKAIEAYQKALHVYTLQAFPKDWAETQTNLGNAYCERIEGVKAENLETAIKAYEVALCVYTEAAFRQQWAQIQNNLGNVYSNRKQGNRAENLEKAIKAYENALRVRTFKAFPKDWADTQHNLGTAYLYRIQGDKADNLEEAIKAYENALKVRNFEALPKDWAETQNNLGEAYRERIKGVKAENLEKAINAYQQALHVYNLKDLPQQWAMIQTNLGIAYFDRIKEDRAENLEKAIKACQQALQVYKWEDFPYEWASTQNTLGNAYSERIREDKAENLEKAIKACQQALQVYKWEDFPYEWAATQNTLGAAYCERIKEDRAENIKQGIACYQNALQIFTKENDPFNCLNIARNLGNQHFTGGNWQPATEAYHLAIEAVETSRSWAMNPERRQEILSDAIGVYYDIVQSYLNLNQPDKALEYVERSKTRNLVEILADRDLIPKGDIPQTVIEELNRLCRAIITEEQQLAIEERNLNNRLIRVSENRRDIEQLALLDYTHLNQLKQQLDELIDRDITPTDPSFRLAQKVETIPYSDIQSLIDERTAIIEWYITGEKILTFLVTHHSRDPQVWQFSDEDLTNLVNWVNEYLRTYDTNREQWKANLETSLPKLAEILHLEEILSYVPPECDRLILIPHRFLHILPLHTLPVSPQIDRRARGEGKYILDLFPRGIQYAPSCQLLKLAQSQQRPDFRNLFAIQNPTGDLVYTDLEVETIRSFLPSCEVLARQAATEEAVKNYQNFPSIHCGHFCCHGEFNPISPLESALILADKEHWTLGEIFELSIPQCRLITLSACETGFTDPNSLSDEYIGLPSGFLFAGSPSVVSSLWTVDDLSTSFLMIKFYEILFNANLNISVAVALKEAQDWLQNLTVKEIEENLAKPTFQQAFSQLQQTLSSGDLFELEDAIASKKNKWKTMSSDEKPFSNPFYWAAFVATGV